MAFFSPPSKLRLKLRQVVYTKTHHFVPGHRGTPLALPINETIFTFNWNIKMRIYLEKIRRKALFFSLIGLLSMAACQRQNGSNLGDVQAPNPFTEGLGGSFDNSGGGSVLEDIAVSDSDSGLDGAQGVTIDNLLDELNEVNPQDESEIPEDLADALLSEEDAMEKIQLAGQVLTHCLDSVGDYVPRPGEPLQGTYGGKCGGTKLDLTITGIYQKVFNRRLKSTEDAAKARVTNSSNFGQTQTTPTRSTSSTQNNGFAGGLGLGNVKFTVSIGNSRTTASTKKNDDNKTTSTSTTNSKTGVMNVSANGSGRFKAGEYDGVATDVGSPNTKPATPPFSATVTREQTGSGKHVTPGCKGNLPMKTSANPIPEKYVQAMKKVGQCYRKALILFSPNFDRVFRNMDPQLRRVFQLKILGLSTNGGRN